MSVKLYATNPEQTRLLTKYIFELARYDQNYDVRDRARFLKALVGVDGEGNVLSKNLQKIFLSRKPAPVLENGAHQGATALQLGSLSAYLKLKATGYRDLPDFPAVAQDSSVRNVQSKIEIVVSGERSLLATEEDGNSRGSGKGKSRDFYSEESSEVDDDEEEKNDSDEWTEDDETSSEETSTSSSESSSESEEEEQENGQDHVEEKVQENVKKVSNVSNPSNLDLLSDLDNSLFSAPQGGLPMKPMGLLQPAAMPAAGKNAVLPPFFTSTEHHELLSKINGFGLGIVYRFTRFNHLTSATHLSVEIVLKNHNTLQEISNIHVDAKSFSSDVIQAFPGISQLPANATFTETLGVDFNDSTQPISFVIVSSLGRSNVSLGAPVGELIQPIKLTEDVFRVERNKLRGMTEHSCSLTTPTEGKGIKEKILRFANVAPVESGEEKVLQFAGQTLKSKSLLLITVLLRDGQEVQVTVNCEKIVMGSILLNDIKSRGL